MISKRISDDIPPQMKILNMVIPILIHFCSFVANWYITSRIKPHVIQQNVTELMTSSFSRQYIAVLQDIPSKILTLSNQMLCYKIKCIRISLYLIEMPFNT